ncbi:flavodoxin [Clostridium celatum]|uniref:Flavodoxin n=1 Tax=Clostridium celatum DSM 1785 TaxID=545697 RepID=L1QN88_9CLOT|nr:flavodoxin [Clostridium celatum]EKY29464.1 flavodoxin [Clostridium celatum DSM 1785]MCE9655365.1 flavodoxin [Clostridium celatum]MDU2266536.1 flavodoxin [Clostridium celatum]MDU3723350.1 flavodoxin [Clostridium celatum]MDU6296892.1 flavodoxin [Clostridium celatum]
MKKVSIIYWSNGGNVEIMANAIAEGASIGDVEVETKNVADSSLEDVLNSDAVAFGSPAMINDEIEEIDMKPFIESLKGIDINNKPLVLFGSCGWRETTFIDKWQEQMKEFGFNVIGKIVVRDSVEKKDIQRSKELGKLLAQV